MAKANKKIKVNINTEEIITGQEIILTLADQCILKDNEVNDDIDVLENEFINEKDKIQLRKQNIEKIKNSKKKNYMSINERLEEDETGEKKLLSQYDELKIDKEGFFLDDSGNLIEDKLKQIQAIASKLKNKSNTEISLFYEDKIASDYKPQIRSTFQKRKTKRQQNGQEDLIKYLEENSRNTSEKSNTQEQAREKSNTAYGDAFDKAKEQTQIAQQRNLLMFEEEDEQRQLQRCLEIKMRAEQKKDLEKNGAKKVQKQEEKLKELIQKNSEFEQEQHKKLEEEFSRPRPKLKENKNGQEKDEKGKDEEKEEIQVISSSTDFLKNVKTEKELQESNLRITAPTSFSVRDSKEGTTSILNVSLPSERLVGTTRIQNSKESQRLDVNSFLNDEEQEEIDKVNDEVDFLHEDNLGKGLAGVLSSLRAKGALADQGHEFIGRSKDKRKAAEFTETENQKEVTLEYRDASGKLMTPKEAFRYQCWIFHGRGPGKNKQEKRKRKLKQLETNKLMTPGEQPLMKTLRTEQEKTNQPYMVLSAKKKFE